MREMLNEHSKIAQIYGFDTIFRILGPQGIHAKFTFTTSIHKSVLEAFALFQQPSTRLLNRWSLVEPYWHSRQFSVALPLATWGPFCRGRRHEPKALYVCRTRHYIVIVFKFDMLWRVFALRSLPFCFGTVLGIDACGLSSSGGSNPNSQVPCLIVVQQ